ncbi:MAG: chemotaxis protein CheX [Methylicorpusculum sp.]|uniref:chemotaxis protein CheX n=1 Tax=Methylicorpusculum sp. TaxID=2713644 RepID=UPI002728FD32|nr:chemotaxis protein CheX [Methylicorpusculum sp.]MDO8843447.1 chemotaxis protein CheX [Methylicorpusculum sp.]MDO8941183.1 chemotaxis protein CheX [Methylicorpusculum sp.]
MLDNDDYGDEFFRDAFAEILNIGMGYAASALSEMVNEEVRLSVPAVEFVKKAEALRLIESKNRTDVSGVHQKFNGSFDGDVFLLFPEEKSLELVRAVLQQDISLHDLTEMEQEAMTEIGNVILNGCLCSMADMFQKEMQGSIPEFVKGAFANILNKAGDKTDACVLMLNMDFAIDQKSVQGYVSFMMDVESLETFKQNIAAYMGL